MIHIKDGEVVQIITRYKVIIEEDGEGRELRLYVQTASQAADELDNVERDWWLEDGSKELDNESSTAMLAELVSNL